MPTSKFSLFTDTLNIWSKKQPQKTACRFMRELNTPPETISYKELQEQINNISAALQTCTQTADRVLLLYPPGLKFIPAFLSCLATGVIAVPAYVPKRKNRPEHIISIVKDADISIVLCAASIKPQLQKQFSNEASLSHLKIIATDKTQAAKSTLYVNNAKPDTVAFLQYTSGSTGNPKGVMVTHGNIFHNVEMLKGILGRVMGKDVSPEIVNWLPLFHDLGLIGNMLQALYTGSRLTLLSPARVLQNPLDWLQTISDCNANMSGGPNFIYDLCCEKISDDELNQLDLSNWTVAFCGAEPVRAETIERFTKKFNACGFRKEAMFPCYGMAEATLYVSSNQTLKPTTLSALPNKENETDNVPNQQLIVSCGMPGPDIDVLIADPDNAEFISGVGEILISSPSVASGYWNKPKLTQEIFIEKKHNNVTKRWLRTGDLGFLKNGELYITGRKKDLIIIGGRNYYPQDIEKTVENSSELFRSNSCAAFSVEVSNKEILVIAAELKRIREQLDVDKLSLSVRQAVMKNHGIAVQEIAFLSIGAIPKTSSGKIRRNDSRLGFINNTLKKIGHWKAQKNNPIHTQKAAACHPDSPERANKLIHWLREYNQQRINSTLIDERRSIPPHIVLDFGNQGLLGMQVPESYGGLGLNYKDSLRVIEQLGAIDITLASFVGVHNALGITPLLNHASPTIHNKWMKSIAQGRDLVAFAITEPSAGSNPRSIKTSAKRVKNGWLLNGEKAWSGTSLWSNIINVFAHTFNEQGEPQGISGFALPQNSNGMHMGPEAMTMGVRGMVQNSIILENVFVSDEQLLGKAGNGMVVAQQAMMLGRLGISAISVGAMKRCAQLMLRYSSRREINTGKLLDNGITLERLTHINHAITCIECLVKSISTRLDKQQDIPQEVYAASKIAGPEYLFQASDYLMQLAGGRGYIESNGIPQIFRDARLLRIFEGPTETLAVFLGSRVLSGKSEIYKFIKEQVNASDLAEKLQDIASNLYNGKTTKAQRQQSQYLLGRYTTLALLQSVTSIDQESTHMWLNQQMKELLQKIKTNAITYNAEEIYHKTISFEQSIGDLDQHTAIQQYDVDELLRKTTKTDTKKTAHLIENLVITEKKSVKENAFRAWLLNWVSHNTETKHHLVDCDTPLIDYGIDSVSALEFSLDLESATNHTINPTLLWEYPTINELANHLETLDIQIKNPPKKENRNKEKTPQTVDDKTAVTTQKKAENKPIQRIEKATPLKYSLMFFSSEDTNTNDDKYNLVLEAAKFADKKNFKGIWLPERHFDAFGGLYPNPSTLAAAISTITKKLRIRAGSVVLPLHHPIRVAEEWSIVDNLSKGRVDLAFVKGWNPNDFVLAPNQYEDRHNTFSKAVKQVQQLWEGHPITLDNPFGKATDVSIHPAPQQKQLPTWITCNKHPQGFIEAGAMGANVLTALLMQTPEELANNIKNYRQARKDNGFNPETGQVTLMMHSYIGQDLDAVKEQVRTPFTNYLKSSVKLWSQSDKDLDRLSEKEQKKLLDFAFEKYFRSSALFGTVESCQPLLQQLQAIGVNEIAALIDFGLTDDMVLSALPMLTTLKDTPIQKSGIETKDLKTSSKLTQADIHLFCLPYAGAKAHVYHSWENLLPNNIILHYLEIPDNYEDLPSALTQLNEQISPYYDKPFAFYGHSMGGLLAFELCRHLQQTNQPQPIQLMIGAQHAPHLPFPLEEPDWHNINNNIELLTKITPTGFTERLKSQPKAAQHMLLPLKKSMLFQQAYQSKTSGKLTCPIRVFFGRNDALLTPQHMKAWSELTQDNFQFHFIDGGHLFLEDSSHMLCKIIQDNLTIDSDTRKTPKTHTKKRKETLEVI